MKKDSLIFIAGESTIAGKSLIDFLRNKQYSQVLNFDYTSPVLTDNLMVKDFFFKKKPEFVFMLGGLSGGIKKNQDNPASLMINNLESIINIFKNAYENNVKKVFFLASSCVYPKYNPQPMNPEELMSGILEPTNSSYAMSKLAGLELCHAYRKEFSANFISAIPTNIFGPFDNFNQKQSHVIPALIRKIHEAKINKKKSINIWGSGSPIREFIYVDDIANACVFLMKNYNGKKPINIGTNHVISIYKLAIKIKNLIGFNGDFIFDETKPDGMPEKVLNSKEILSLGWIPKISLDKGLVNTYNWFLSKGYK